jgi:hypothetical protein
MSEEHRPEEIPEVIDDPNSPDDQPVDQLPYPDVDDLEPDDEDHELAELAQDHEQEDPR